MAPQFAQKTAQYGWYKNDINDKPELSIIEEEKRARMKIESDFLITPAVKREQEIKRLTGAYDLGVATILVDALRKYEIFESISNQLPILATQYRYRRGTKRMENRIDKLYRKV